MFYGQNCSGRLGERKTVISIVGSKNDYNFTKFINKFKLKKIKRNLNKKYFSIALHLAREYDISVSLAVIPSNQFGEWKFALCKYPKWFSRLYGIVCFRVLKPIIDRTVYLQMDREYNDKTLAIAAEVIRKLSSSHDVEIGPNSIYIRKEKEYPPNRIVIADLFARGCYNGFDCGSLSITKNLIIKNEIQKVFGEIR